MMRLMCNPHRTLTEYEAEAYAAFSRLGYSDWTSFFAGWKARDGLMIDAINEGIDRGLSKVDTTLSPEDEEYSLRGPNW